MVDGDRALIWEILRYDWITVDYGMSPGDQPNNVRLTRPTANRRQFVRQRDTAAGGEGRVREQQCDEQDGQADYSA